MNLHHRISMHGFHSLNFKDIEEEILCRVAQVVENYLKADFNRISRYTEHCCVLNGTRLYIFLGLF